MTHLKVDCQIQQKIKKLSDTIEGLEIMLEQKEHRIEELEAEVRPRKNLIQWNLRMKHMLGQGVLSFIIERFPLF